MRPIALYPITVTRATMMAETGTRYGVHPFGANTDRIEGETGEPDRVLVLADDVTLYLGRYGDLVAERSPLSGQVVPSPSPLDELIDVRGRVIDGAWGYTRQTQPGDDYTTADAITAALVWHGAAEGTANA